MHAMSLAPTTATQGWKNIAVFLDDTAASRKLGAQAIELARRCGAHLIGIHTVSNLPTHHRCCDFVRGGKAIDEVIARHRAAGEATTAAIGQRFSALAVKHGVSPEFRVIRDDPAGDDAVLNSLDCDLIVIGHPHHGLPAGWSAERLLMASGVPLLIIPDEWTSDRIGTSVLVCWNASPQARRAITDALPCLVAAPAVTVLVVDAAERPHRHGQEPGAGIALYLARHGAQVDLERVSSNGARVTDAIVAQARQRGVDLIVAGAYSHPRWSELMFGGVTRRLLAKVPIPLLMSR